MGDHKDLKPGEALAHFYEYKKITKETPKEVQDYVGGAGKEVYRLRERPLTITGFELYLRAKGVIADLKRYLSNFEGRYADYVDEFRIIKMECDQDQIEGGLLKLYDPGITARLQGLTDKTETKISGALNIPELPDIGNRK